MSGKRSRGVDVVEDRAVKKIRGPNRPARWIAKKQYRNYVFECKDNGTEATLTLDDFLPPVVEKEEPVVSDYDQRTEATLELDDFISPVVEKEKPTEPVVSDYDQKAERKAAKKAAKKARKSEMKALLEAGGEPEIKNDGDQKLWNKVKAKAVPVVSDYEEEEEDEFMGFGDDVEPIDENPGPTDFSYADDGAFEPEQPVDDEQAQALGIAFELDNGARLVGNDEITIDDFEIIDDIGRVAATNVAAGTVSDDLTAPHDHDFDNDPAYELVPNDYKSIQQNLVAFVDDTVYLATNGYDPATVGNGMFKTCSVEHHRLQLYQSFRTDQNRSAATRITALAGRWKDVDQGCVPLKKVGLKTQTKNVSTHCTDCEQKIKFATSLSRLLCSLQVADDQLWRMAIETAGRAPMYQTSHRCNEYQRENVCLNSEHFQLETNLANITRTAHHSGRHGCYDKISCFGPSVRRLRLGTHDPRDLGEIRTNFTAPPVIDDIRDELMDMLDPMLRPVVDEETHMLDPILRPVVDEETPVLDPMLRPVVDEETPVQSSPKDPVGIDKGATDEDPLFKSTKRSTQACKACRTRKTRCVEKNEGQCVFCESRGQMCEYLVLNKSGPKKGVPQGPRKKRTDLTVTVT
ncbi:hypothetical protein LTS10_001055 [Elasticomyces elasticus]|nr:hypothetical protein LTS10_001055 [Elasticomyces elasticus]